VPVIITEKHLVASDKRMTYSDTKQKGFALRTTPNGVFTFYYQHLNEGDRQARLAPDRLSSRMDPGACAQRGNQARRVDRRW
jgi:hypothetical protein